MRASLIIVIGVASEYAPEVTFAQYDQVIETLSADGANHSFCIRILPRRARCGRNVLDLERCDLAPESFAIDRIPIPDEEARCIACPTRFQKLSGRPCRRRVLCDVKVQDSPTIMTQDDEYEQDPEGRRWDCKEIEGDQLLGMVLKECSPVLGRRPAMLDHVLGHGGFRDLDPELQQFTVDSRCAPQRISLAHSADQRSDFGIDPRTTSVTAFPSPVVAKPLAVPANDGCRLNDVE